MFIIAKFHHAKYLFYQILTLNYCIVHRTVTPWSKKLHIYRNKFSHMQFNPLPNILTGNSLVQFCKINHIFIVSNSTFY